MNQHFMQSKTWEDYEKLEGYQTFRIESDNYSALALLETTPIGNYLFCPYGPTLDETSPKSSLKAAIKALSELAKNQNAFFVRIEPTLPPSLLSTDDLLSLGCKKSHDLDPAHTWILDLTLPEAELLKNMRKSNVQYWHSHQKKGLTIRQTKDPEEISILTSLLQGVSDKNHFNPQAESHLKNQLKSGFATLYVAELNHQPLAASLIYDFNDTRFYAHAATSNSERKLTAGTVLLVQMILDAKNQGAKSFDFWGITTSEDPHHPWYGFSKYKKSFGGSLVSYSGTWDYPIKPSKYLIYSFIRKLNRLKRKFLK